VSGTLIAVTAQAMARILVLDPEDDWADPAAVRWSWTPDPAAEFSGGETPGGAAEPQPAWHCLDDVRLRRDAHTGQAYVLACASGGLLAQVRYPQGGMPVWAAELGHAPNPHGIELLPDGNIAAAASHGNWVRVYVTDGRAMSPTFVQAPLAGAHQVLWDEKLQVLWALGGGRLVKYHVGGSRRQPSLHRLAAFRLPTRGGHDLQPDPLHPDRLWVTTVYGVHQFVKSAGRFTAEYPRRRRLYAMHIKSIGTDPVSGTVLQTTPARDDPTGWRTDRVDLFPLAGKQIRKVLPGSGIYRARWFDPRAN